MKKIRALFLELPSSFPLTGGVNSLNRSTFSGVEKREMDVGKKGDHGTSVNRVTQRTQRKTAMFLLFMASR